MEVINIKPGPPVEVTFKVKKVPKFIIACLVVALTGVVILPLIGVFFGLIYGNGPHIGFVFGLLVFGLIARFLVRTICWNLFGFEKWIISEKEISYEADYKYFRGRSVKLESPFTLGFIFQYENEKDRVQLTAESEENQITSVIKIAKKDAQHLATQLPLNVFFLD